jgi:hypothetical protein
LGTEGRTSNEYPQHRVRFIHDDARDRTQDAIKSPKKNRLKLDFAPKAMERLNALRLYEAPIEESESGKQFPIKDEAGSVAPFRLFL